MLPALGGLITTLGGSAAVAGALTGVAGSTVGAAAIVGSLGTAGAIHSGVFTFPRLEFGLATSAYQENSPDY